MPRQLVTPVRRGEIVSSWSGLVTGAEAMPTLPSIRVSPVRVTWGAAVWNTARSTVAVLVGGGLGVDAGGGVGVLDLGPTATARRGGALDGDDHGVVLVRGVEEQDGALAPGDDVGGRDVGGHADAFQPD